MGLHAPEESVTISAGFQQGEQTDRLDAGKPPERREIPKKLVAIVVVTVVATASLAAAWFVFFRANSIEDIAGYVVYDPTVAAPGFKHSLAGDALTVKGKVTNITTYSTTLGNMSFVELDDYYMLHLVVWGEVPYDVGDRIKTQVGFEWSVCNDENHVYSPQLDFPVFAHLPAIATVVKSVAAVAGTVLTIASESNESLVLQVFDRNPVLPLDQLNCSLRVGRHSFAQEYIDVLGIGSDGHEYGNEIDSIVDLAAEQGPNGTLSFNDVDGDGNLSQNDTFELRDLDRPDMPSGAFTYALVLEIDSNEYQENLSADAYPMAYLVMTDRGVLSHPTQQTPYMRIEGEVMSDTEVKATFVRTERNPSWDDVELAVHYSNQSYWTGSWNPTAGGLNNGTQSLLEMQAITVGDLTLTCRITDISGNGVVNEGDYFVVTAAGGTPFTPGTHYEVLVLFEPNMASMASFSFEM